MKKKVDMEIITENSMAFALGLFRELSDSEKSLVAGSGGGRRRGKRRGRRRKKRSVALCRHNCGDFLKNCPSVDQVYSLSSG